MQKIDVLTTDGRRRLSLIERNTFYSAPTSDDQSGCTSSSADSSISQLKLQLALDLGGMGLWDFDLVSGRMQWDERWQEAVGFSAEEGADYQSFLTRVHEADREQVSAALTTAMSSEGSGLCDIRFRIVPAEEQPPRFLALHGQTLFSEEQGVKKPVRFLATVMDITDRVQGEEALKRSEKLATAGKLAATIAHEINNPLEAISNLLFLARQTESPSEVHHYLEFAEQELTRVVHLTTQTLRFHRQSTEALPTDLGDLCRSVLDLYGSRIVKKGIKVRLALRPAPHLVVFASELRQVIANFVVNAIDATSPGGILHVRLRAASSPIDGATGLRLTIADTGNGIAPADLPHIFEPFFTTKGEAGTGLGLWVSKQILEKHRGAISVKSSRRSDCSGTVFSIFLPQAKANSLHGGILQSKVA